MKTRREDQSTTPREGASPPHWMLWLLPFVDRIIARLLGIKAVDAAKGIMGISLHHYRGCPRALADGTAIRPGALVCEIHVLNGRLARLARQSPRGEITPWEMATLMSRDLGLLAGRIVETPKVEALYGTTLLDAGVRRLGFTVMDMPPNLASKAVAFYMRGLMLAYHSRGARSTEKRARNLHLKELWMSRGELLSKYGAGGSLHPTA